MNKTAALYIGLAVTFIVGEAAALSGPIFGLDGSFAWVAGPVALAAAIVMGGFAVVLPLVNSAVGRGRTGD